MKRFLSLLLIILLFVGCARGKATAPEPAYHTELTFPELRESGEDAALELARAKELVFRIGRGELSGTRAQEALDARTAAYERLGTDAALAYVRYCLDVTDEKNKRRYDTLSVELDALGCVLVDAALLLSEDPALSAYYDAETVERLMRADALSDLSLQPLLERERALTGRYEALSETLFTEWNGKQWNGDAILSDPTLSEEDFALLYERYMALFNEEAGEIYLELIAVRNEIAAALGFDSYADYAYACYARDYTPQDAARFSETVREAFSPLLLKMRGAFYAAAGALYGAVFEEEPTMARIRAAIVSLLPELSEPWDYMIAHRMYDLGTNPSRMPGSFTTYLASYGTPFLFSAWTNGFDVPQTVIHEFGHFAAYWQNGAALREGNPLDLAEIDSQGLELMSVLRYDTVYGDLSEAAATAQLFYTLYALVDGCLEDEFQRFAYGGEGITLEALNAEYARLLTRYGLDAFGIDGRSWTQIPHTFQSPFYYISYATSAAAALELLLNCRADPEEAVRTYRSIVMRPGGAQFRETLRSAGLSDPFDASSLAAIARDLHRLRKE